MKRIILTISITGAALLALATPALAQQCVTVEIPADTRASIVEAINANGGGVNGARSIVPRFREANAGKSGIDFNCSDEAFARELASLTASAAAPVSQAPQSASATPPPSNGVGGAQVASGAVAMQEQIDSLEARLATANDPGTRTELQRMLAEARATKTELARQESRAQGTIRTLRQQRTIRPLTATQVQQLNDAQNALEEIRKNREAVADALKQALDAAGRAKASATAANGSATAAKTSADSAEESATAAAVSAQEAKDASWAWWQIALIALAVFLLLGLPLYFLARKGMAKKTELDAIDKNTMQMEPTSETAEELKQMESQENAATRQLQFRRQDGEVCTVDAGRREGSWICEAGVGDHSDSAAPIKDIMAFVRKANRHGRLNLSY